ncbi:UDP-N-acetylmuramoyl-L-alanyl-D-glutamate--2,6-diaminopimelate ligase [Marinospirillum sp.]|uniref:UDP-N-acetylmuramoyl-L-alanyl-D-glutamate--2, 6-diaminopimelate ligase n=1 Tax=Marinospirillum sp. TaxID=2183934 RepID=UPI00384B3077
MSHLQLPKAINPLSCWSNLWPGLAELQVPLTKIQRLVNDSRQVMPGDVFFALQGVSQSGQLYQDQALERGACLVVHEGELNLKPLGAQAWQLSLPDLKAHLGKLLALSSAADFSSLRTTAITGTNGKSSVAHFLCQLRQQLGQKSALVGTLGYGELDKLQPASHTTPDLFRLHQFYLDWMACGVQEVCLEASSHALDQGRLDGLPVTTAVFTNLTRDHLDYHRTLEAYAEAKSQLFLRPELQVRVVNLDDPLGRKLAEPNSTPLTLGYSLQQPEADLSLTHSVFSEQGVTAEITWQGQSHSFTLPLLGLFNLANLLAALGVLLAEGHSLPQLLPLISRLQPVKGRMQRVTTGSSEAFQELPSVVVDYAHTPDALQQALQALRPHVQGRIYCVLGCGGDRDQGKRALMAQVASQEADCLVVTDDNPRNEYPARIRQQLLQAAPQATEIADRAQAIHWAIQQAQPGDWVLVAGKGHEDYQEVAGQRLPFADQEVAEEALQARRRA